MAIKAAIDRMTKVNLALSTTPKSTTVDRFDNGLRLAMLGPFVDARDNDKLQAFIVQEYITPIVGQRCKAPFMACASAQAQIGCCKVDVKYIWKMIQASVCIRDAYDAAMRIGACPDASLGDIISYFLYECVRYKFHDRVPKAVHQHGEKTRGIGGARQSVDLNIWAQCVRFLAPIEAALLAHSPASTERTAELSRIRISRKAPVHLVSTPDVFQSDSFHEYRREPSTAPTGGPLLFDLDPSYLEYE
jgi:hypothetical protein